MFIRLLLVPLLIAATTLPAFARTTVIAELGTAPLLGSSASTREMRARVAANAGYVSAAAKKIGLSPREYAAFSAAIASSRAGWVTLPRHLDAMSWRSGSQVYVLHDVIIPAKTHGWEVDVDSAHQHVAIYMPAACGNVSVVRSAVRAIAHRPAPVALPAPVVATAVPPPDVVQAPVIVPDDTPVLAPEVVAAAKPEFPPTAAAHHRPLFLAPLLFGLAALSGGSGSGPIAVVPEGCP